MTTADTAGTTTRRYKALQRARVLLAIAADQAGTPEGQTAAELAAKLTERWKLTEAEVQGLAVGHGKAAGSSYQYNHDIPLWLQTLLLVIAEAHGCDASGLDVVGPAAGVRAVEAEFARARKLIERCFYNWRQRERKALMDWQAGAGAGGGVPPLYAPPGSQRADLIEESYGVTAALTLQARLKREAATRRRVDEIVAGSLAGAQDAIRRATALKPYYVEERKRSKVGKIQFAYIGDAELMVERMAWPPEA